MDYESGFSVRWGTLCGWASAFVLAASAPLACGGDDGPSSTACNFDADCGDGQSCDDHVCVADGQQTGGDGSGEDSGSGAGDDDGPATDTGGDDDSGGSTGADTGGLPPDTSMCDPDARLFDGDPRQASISIDEGTMTCAAHSLASEDPQWVLDIRPTGLCDVTATGGLTIQSSTQGTYVNDTSVVGITTEIPVTMMATSPGGTPLKLDFTIDEVGPQVAMVRVEWNPM